jgi:hypothetical protein
MCTRNCLCNSCHKRNKCSDCPYVDIQDNSNNPWSVICSTTGIKSCDYYIKPPEISCKIEEEKPTIIKFKNGSSIETIENSGDIVRGKMHDFQYEDISEYIKYMKQHPYKFAELITGKKLHFWQRAYLGVVSVLYSIGDVILDDIIKRICDGK